MRQKKEEWLLKRKRVLNLLKRGPRRYSELVQETGIPSSTMDLILGEFGEKGLGILCKVNGCWAFFGDIVSYKQSSRTSSEQERLLEHSRTLLPGFEAILAESWQGDLQRALKVAMKEGDSIKIFAEQHLHSGYREIYDELKEYRKFLTTTGRNLQKTYPKEIVRLFTCGIFTLSSNPELSKNWPWSGLPPEDIAEALQQKLARYMRLETAISNIEYHIRLGRSLEGECDGCPLK